MEYNAKDRCCGWCYGLGATMKCADAPVLIVPVNARSETGR